MTQLCGGERGGKGVHTSEVCSWVEGWMGRLIGEIGRSEAKEKQKNERQKVF